MTWISGEEMQIAGMVETIGGIVLVILFIEFGLSVYFLVIVAKFDKKLASEMNYGQRKGMVLEPLRTT